MPDQTTESGQIGLDNGKMVGWFIADHLGLPLVTGESNEVERDGKRGAIKSGKASVGITEAIYQRIDFIILAKKLGNGRYFRRPVSGLRIAFSSS